MQEKINKTELFLQNLRFLVNKTGLKDCQIANDLGIHKVSFSRYFTEERIPKRTVLEKMATYFGVSMTQLLNENIAAEQVPVPAAITPQLDNLPETITSDEFKAFVVARTEDLQRQINDFVAELLIRLPRVQR